MSKSAKEHWSDHHVEGHQGALTGTPLWRLLSFFPIEDKLKPGVNVLNVGVGLGHCTRSIAAMGCNIYVMDICQEAVDKVSDVTSGSFLHESSSELPDNKFDVAYSFLVTQHMSEDDILSQFPNVIRSLKDGARFYVQFAGSDRPGENNNPGHIVGTPGDGKVSMLGGRMVRTMDYAKELVEKCGGTVVESAHLKRFPMYQSYWYYLAIEKARDE